MNKGFLSIYLCIFKFILAVFYGFHCRSLSPSWFFFFNCILGFGVHVKNMQDCCIRTNMAVWCAAFLPITYIWHFSPCYLSPTPNSHCHSPISPLQTTVYDASWVHVFSLFNTHLWMRTRSVWFSVFVLVCWEWWFPGSSMSLQRTWTHRFWWLHNIPWCICATFSLSSLPLMGIWVGSRSLLL